jgi:hypothetical protein
MQGGLGMSSWLLIAITILLVLQLFSMAVVSGGQLSHQLHGNCLKVLHITITCSGMVNSIVWYLSYYVSTRFLFSNNIETCFSK